jgi:very-short-patch-repair endonuclease
MKTLEPVATKANGYRVLRFSNEEFLRHPQSVVYGEGGLDLAYAQPLS